MQKITFNLLSWKVWILVSYSLSGLVDNRIMRLFYESFLLDSYFVRNLCTLSIGLNTSAFHLFFLLILQYCIIPNRLPAYKCSCSWIVIENSNVLQNRAGWYVRNIALWWHIKEVSFLFWWCCYLHRFICLLVSPQFSIIAGQFTIYYAS